jgi:KaiC domain protein
MSDEEDTDWFERALEEVEAESAADAENGDGTEPEPNAAGESGDEASPEERTEGDEGPIPFDDLDSSTPTGETEGEPSDGSAFEGASDDGWTSLGGDPGSDDAWDDLTAGSSPDDPSEDDAGRRQDPFEEDLADAFDSPPATDSGGPAGESGNGDFGFGDFSGGSGGGGDDFGFGDFSGGSGGGGGGGGDFGFGGSGGTDFDEEEFESDIDRIEIGIEGLDEMILGGVPERAMIAAVGSAGTGKTTFGLQFLHTALENDQRAVYITLEESRESIFDTADAKGWNFSKHAKEDRLVVIDLHPIEMANSLATIRDDLPRLIEEFGAQRLVLDSVSLLEMMYDKPSERRSEVFEFARSLKDAGVTTFVTSEASDESAYASRYGIIEYLADAVFVLQYVRPSDFRETRLAVEIQKIRDANHSRETKPYEITSQGISVYRQANIF